MGAGCDRGHLLSVKDEIEKFSDEESVEEKSDSDGSDYVVVKRKEGKGQKKNGASAGQQKATVPRGGASKRTGQGGQGRGGGQGGGHAGTSKRSRGGGSRRGTR